MPASSLSELLLTHNRPAVATDLEALVDAEVSSTGGASGLVIKSGYAMAKKSKPGFVRRMLNDMLPEITGTLEPYYQEAVDSGATVTAVFAAKAPEISSAVAVAAKKYVDESGRDGLRKGYKRFGDQAPQQIQAALPKIAALIEKYQAAS